jgi:hypothetical protein
VAIFVSGAKMIAAGAATPFPGLGLEETVGIVVKNSLFHKESPMKRNKIQLL